MASLITSDTRPTAATPAAHRPANQASRLMIAMLADLAAEHPIGPAGISEDDRHQHSGAGEHEALARIRRGRLPDRDPAWNDVGPDRDGEARHGEQEQQEADQEGHPVAAPRQAQPQTERNRA